MKLKTIYLLEFIFKYCQNYSKFERKYQYKATYVTVMIH